MDESDRFSGIVNLTQEQYEKLLADREGRIAERGDGTARIEIARRP